MGDRSLTYDANAARPGLTFTPPSTPGMQIPTPMGWLSPDMASSQSLEQSSSHDMKSFWFRDNISALMRSLTIWFG